MSAAGRLARVVPSVGRLQSGRRPSWAAPACAFSATNALPQDAYHCRHLWIDADGHQNRRRVSGGLARTRRAAAPFGAGVDVYCGVIRESAQEERESATDAARGAWLHRLGQELMPTAV